MQKIKSLLAIPIVMGATALIVPPSESQVIGVPGKAIKEIEKAAKKTKDGIKDGIKVGGCAGTREGCNPEKKIKKLFKNKMKKCVKAPCPVW